MRSFRCQWLALLSLAGLYKNVAAAPGAVRDPDIPLGGAISVLRLPGLVKHINAFITLDSLVTNEISVNFDVTNPLILELTIDRIISDAGLNGSTYAHFDQTFPGGLVIPILGSANSGTFGNVNLTQGATAALDIIPAGVLDLDADVFVRVATIHGRLGIPVRIKGLKQAGVSTTYTLDA